MVHMVRGFFTKKTERMAFTNVFFLILIVFFCSYPSAVADNNGDGPNLSYFTASDSGLLTVGDSVYIIAQFDADIGIGSTMTVTLDTGASITLNRSCFIDDGNEYCELKGLYTITAGESSPLLSVTSIDSASVKDTSDGTGTDYSVIEGANIGDDNGGGKAITVDTVTPPQLLAIRSTSSSGKYVAGQDIAIIAEFDKRLDASSTLEIVLDTGASVLLDQVSGSSLTGTYTIGSGDISEDLKASSVLSATVKNTGGNVGSEYLVPGFNFNSNDIEIGTTFAIPIAAGARYSAVIGNRIYVNDFEGDTVSVIDSITDTNIATISVGHSPYYSASVGTKLYVTNASDNSVSVIDADPSSGTYNTVISTIIVGNLPYYIFSFGTKVYVGFQSSNSVAVIDTTNTSGSAGGTVIANISVGGHPDRFAVVGNKVYVDKHDGSSISVIDTTNTGGSAAGTVIATINVGSGNLDINAIGTKVYVSNRFSQSISVIDTTNTTGSAGGTVIGTISVGSNPLSFSVLGQKIYVNNTNSHTVSVIDTTNTTGSAGGTVVGTIAVGTGPIYSASLNGKIYVVNSDNTVSVIDPTNISGSPGGTVIETIEVGTTPISFSAASKKLYVVNLIGNVSVIDSIDDEIVNVLAPHLTSFTSTTTDGTYTSGQSINITANFNKALDSESKMRVTLTTGAVVDLTTVVGSTLSGTYNVGSHDSSPDLSVSSISTNPSFTRVSDTSITPNTQSNFSVLSSPELTGDVSRNLGDTKNIVVGTPIPIAIAVGTNPYQMVTVGTLVYEANQGSDSVKVINTSNNEVEETISVGSQPYGVAYNSTSKEIYVANLKGNTVSVIDADSSHVGTTFNTVTNTISVGVEPYYVASLGTKIYVTNSLSWTVSVIDTSNHTVTATISVGAHPRGIKAHGTDLYVANFGSNYGGVLPSTVSVINSLNNTVTQTINVGSGARGVAVNGDEVYVANFNDDTVSVISTTSNIVTHTISVGHHPRGMLSLGTNIYVENFDDGTISVISTSSHVVTATIMVGNTPAGMTAVGTDIYFSRFTDGVVSIIDTSNSTLRSVSTDSAESSSSSESSSPQAIHSGGGHRGGGLLAGISIGMLKGAAPSMPVKTDKDSSSLFAERTCQRVMRWFGNNEKILRKVYERLERRFGFQCNT